jgi:hypothetical protein
MTDVVDHTVKFSKQVSAWRTIFAKPGWTKGVRYCEITIDAMNMVQNSYRIAFGFSEAISQMAMNVNAPFSYYPPTRRLYDKSYAWYSR